MMPRTQNLLLLFVSLLVSVLLAEITLRLVEFSYPNLYRQDLQLGAVLRPRAQGWWREEGESFVRINSAGMRDDREISTRKDDNIVRIAVLGDSYVEALQVPVGQSFWRLLERELEDCAFAPGKRIEVLNFGVSGYSTAQELLTLRHRARAYGPDMVLLAFLSGNDVRDNSREIAGRYPRPYLDRQADGTLTVDTGFRSHWIFRLKASSIWEATAMASDSVRLLQLFNKVKNIVGQPLSAANSMESELDVGLDDHIYLSRPPEVWERAWRLTEVIVAQVRRESAEIGARFLLVTLSNPIQVASDPTRARGLAEKLGETDLFYPERRMRAFAEREGFDAVFLAEDFAAHATKTRTPLHGFANTQPDTGHWNENGHALAATLVARKLCAQSQLSRPTVSGEIAEKAGR